jgi:signal transduction histidine kinase
LTEIKHPPVKRSNWRGFTLQLFLITVLPLTVLLLAVAFGSQALHHQAMRSLVGDRDLQTVRAASSSLERELSHLTSMIQILSRDLVDKNDFSSLILSPEEISSIFDGGLALFSTDGYLIRSSSTLMYWKVLPSQLPDFFQALKENNSQPVFSSLVASSGASSSYILIGTYTNQQEFLVGAFTPSRLIDDAISDLAGSSQTSVLVIGPSKEIGSYDVLFRSGPIRMDDRDPSHPGISEVLNGESGINYYQSTAGEHVVAFSPIPMTGWGLVIEEAWEDIASPYLITTQSAPLVIVPVFLLAVLAVWFGARRIVTPLQKLEKQAAGLAAGDFEAIRQSVGGIEEIRNLQSELIEMADKLKAAQRSLRSYIGAITASVENERRSLARELHDDTIQTLIALNQRIQMILKNSPKLQKGPLNELQTLVQQSMTNLRRMIRGLRPIYLEDLGLVASLDMLVHEIGETFAIPIKFSSLGQELRLDPQKEMMLYRMVQESLNNVIQHAHARHAWVEIEFTKKELGIQIRDDGKGFKVPYNPSEFPEKGHFGLLGLHERAELIHAALEISSRSRKGTTISIRLPISAT